jgi:predicted transcriptional regulator
MTHGADQTAIIDRCETDADARSERLKDALEDPHCRYLLEYLGDAEGPSSVSEVATHVVAQITDTDPEDISSDVAERVQTWFYHGQLPMLDDYGVIEFDPDSGTVYLTDDSAA